MQQQADIQPVHAALTDTLTASEEDQCRIVAYDHEGQQYFQRQQGSEGAGQGVGQQTAVGPDQGQTRPVEPRAGAVF